MRSLVLALTLTIASSLAAQTAFPLGTGEIVPIPAQGFHAVRSGAEVVAVWSAYQSPASYFGRFDFEGNRIGEVAPILADGAPCSEPQIATSPRETLIVCSAGALFSMRVTGEGLSEPNVVAAEGAPVALRWSGREFVALIRNADSTHSLVRLDRDGHPTGGRVVLRNVALAVPSFACGDTRCMVAFTDREQVRIAIVNEADYPAEDDSRIVPLTYLFSAPAIAIGFDDLGFYSVTAGEKLILRRHGKLRSGARARDLQEARQLVFGNRNHTQLFTDSEGSDIYVASGYSDGDSSNYPLLYRISPSGVVGIRDTTSHREKVASAVVALPSSAFVFWRYFYDDPHFIRLSATSSSLVRTVTDPVTRGVASEVLPRLALGNDTLLATWVEAGAEDKLLGAILDRDGRPLTPPIRIATAALGAIHDAVIAFDGVHFLVIWRSGSLTRPVHGRLISQNGQLASEPLEWQFDPQWLTLVWTGTEYLASANDHQVRISSAGTFLGDLWFPEGMVVPNEWGGLDGLTYSFEGAILGAGPNLFARYCLSSHSGNCSFGNGVGSFAPAMATGGGETIAVYYSSGWAYGLFLYPHKRLPDDDLTGERTARLHAHWTGTGFVTGSGRTFLRHAPDGTLLSRFSIGSDVTDVAAVPDGPDTMIVLRQRGRDASDWERPSRSIEAVRISIPAN